MMLIAHLDSITFNCGHGVSLMLDCELCVKHLRPDLKVDCRIMYNLDICKILYRDSDSIVTRGLTEAERIGHE